MLYLLAEFLHLSLSECVYVCTHTKERAGRIDYVSQKSLSVWFKASFLNYTFVIRAFDLYFSTPTALLSNGSTLKISSFLSYYDYQIFSVSWISDVYMIKTHLRSWFPNSYI